MDRAELVVQEGVGGCLLHALDHRLQARRMGIIRSRAVARMQEAQKHRRLADPFFGGALGPVAHGEQLAHRFALLPAGVGQVGDGRDATGCQGLASEQQDALLHVVGHPREHAVADDEVVAACVDLELAQIGGDEPDVLEPGLGNGLVSRARSRWVRSRRR